MSLRIGLTGSIGMGKSTTASMFAEEGCAVWDADDAVHRLYAEGGAAVAPLGDLVPNALINSGISRERLKMALLENPGLLARIEAIVHPLVAEDRRQFTEASEADIIVFDIPLLFEIGADKAMDRTVCVSVPSEVQKARVMARGTMTQEQFEDILARQMPNAEKCARADHVILTDTLEHAHAQVHSLVSTWREGLGDA
ncbi:dephospho-CoA kinase [Poseidonocella sedimentorum]|uniref:Dephospho-CoA kinase n=1 Tax=Poseidonocella sedimentorum TaxID=871652 RepID=A0A1I6D6M1_9RHOB|nr:dephospho-CoA kinase [Poseidonocella sedimentorum]SFR01098.1 dephospho-CoA kinase [Poseidonocella sedimentorum]